MEIPDYFVALLQKYFSGETTPEENRQIEEYVKRGDVEKNLFKEHAKLHRYAVDVLNLTESHDSVQTSKRNLVWYSAAASVVLIAMLSYFNLRHNHADTSNYLTFMVDNAYQKKVNPNENQVVKNQFGEVIAKIENGVMYVINSKSSNLLNLKIDAGKKMKIVLEDHTEISLNSASDISFSDSFLDKSERVVTLNGEAFFSVAKNPLKPFFVKTKLFTTRVLGTKFNVNSYNEDGQNSVYLVEGSIAVDKLAGTQEIVLKPGEGLGINKTDQFLQKMQKQKGSDEVAWLKNEIIFDNEPLSEIFNKIERMYGVKINNKAAALSATRFSGRFKDEPVDNVMKTIQAAVNCTYSIDDKTITITR